MMKRSAIAISLLGGACLVLLLLLLASMLGGFPAQSGLAQSSVSIPLPAATMSAAQMTGLPPLSPEFPFESTPNPGIPTLQEIVGDVPTDADALQRISAYYNTHESELRALFDEENPERLRVLYAMHIIHISHVYGEADVPTTLIDYLKGTYAHCGLYTRFMAEILDTFGMTWRIMYHMTAEHAWVEVPIDGKWELFDPTVNLWIDTDGSVLLAGMPRQTHPFYTPMNDPSRPDAREYYFRGPAEHPRIGWTNIPRLRTWMLGLGLTYTPATDVDDYFVWASAPGQGSDRNQPWSDGLS